MNENMTSVLDDILRAFLDEDALKLDAVIISGCTVTIHGCSVGKTTEIMIPPLPPMPQPDTRF